MSINTAEQLEENEQYDKAYEEYKKIYAQKPKNIDVLERLGHVAMILNKKDEAAEFYVKVLELDAANELAHEQLMDIYCHTDRFKYYTMRGNLHVLQQELSHAIGDFKKAIDKAQTEQQMSTTRFALANLYEITGKHHQAIDEYLRIIDTSSLNESVYLRLAQVYFKEDAISSAVEILERARANGFDTETVKETLAQLYLKNNEPDKARGLTKDELVRVKSLLEEGKNESAYEVLQNLDTKDKENSQYHLLLAQYYFNTKNWDKGLEAVEAFEKLEQNSPLVYQMRALIYEEQGKDFDAHMNWAKYNLSRGDREVALNEYFSAYQIKADDVILVRNLAELLDDMGDKAHALEFWEKLCDLDSGNRKALEKVAEFKESIGDYRSEADVLEKLYALDNKNALVVKKLAKSYEKIKNKDKALAFYNKFIEISPVNDEAEQIKAKIKKLESTAMEEDEGLIGKIMKVFGK